MLVWDEVTKGRGLDEVASCLMKWFGLRGAPKWCFDEFFENSFIALLALNSIFHVPDDNIG